MKERKMGEKTSITWTSITVRLRLLFICSNKDSSIEWRWSNSNTFFFSPWKSIHYLCLVLMMNEYEIKIIRHHEHHVWVHILNDISISSISNIRFSHEIVTMMICMIFILGYVDRVHHFLEYQWRPCERDRVHHDWMNYLDRRSNVNEWFDKVNQTKIAGINPPLSLL